MSLKFYYDLLSQPCRALHIFMKKCNIPFEPILIDLKTGDQLLPSYQKINPFQKVPVIDHNGFKLTER